MRYMPKVYNLLIYTSVQFEIYRYQKPLAQKKDLNLSNYFHFTKKNS